LEPFKKLISPIIILLLIIAFGIFGYSLVEKWPLLDSIYMVVITLFSVGFKEAQPLTEYGKIFTIFFIIIGVAASIYAAGQIIEIIVEGQILGIRRKKKMEKTLRNLKDHFIICGFGRVGHQIGKEFDNANIKYVIIDNNPELTKQYESQNALHIIGDATSDKKLLEAGIKNARGLIASSDSDVANVYITLSARELNKELLIIARASEVDTEGKLKIAGATRVLSPSFISGKRMANWATRPVASDFLEMVTHNDNRQFNLQEVPIPDDSSFIGKTLNESKIKELSEIAILAIQNKNGEFNLQPSSNTIINSGDTLVTIGTKDHVEKINGMN